MPTRRADVIEGVNDGVDAGVEGINEGVNKGVNEGVNEPSSSNSSWCELSRKHEGFSWPELPKANAETRAVMPGLHNTRKHMGCAPSLVPSTYTQLSPTPDMR